MITGLAQPGLIHYTSFAHSLNAVHAHSFKVYPFSSTVSLNKRVFKVGPPTFVAFYLSKIHPLEPRPETLTQ